MFRVYGKIDKYMDPGLFVYSSMATMASDSHASSSTANMYGQTGIPGIPGIRDFREFAACMIAYRPNYSKIVNLANPCIDHVILWGGNNWRPTGHDDVEGLYNLYNAYERALIMYEDPHGGAYATYYGTSRWDVDRGYLMTMMGTTLRTLGRSVDAIKLFGGALRLNAYDVLALDMMVGAQTDMGVAICEMYDPEQICF